jgi:hypothetical protein
VTCTLRRVRRRLLILGWCLALAGRVAAADHAGQVTMAGAPVPGVTVTAAHGDVKVVTTTDRQGVYRFTNLADGDWLVHVEMLGFVAQDRTVTVAAGSPVAGWELVLRPFEEIARDVPAATAGPSAANVATEPNKPAAVLPPTPESAAAGQQRSGRVASANTPSPSATRGGFQRAGVNESAPPAAAATPSEPAAPSPFGTADGLLVNGSVNNGAASPFAQLAAFGNNRRGARSLYNGGAAVILGNSAWDARPFSFTNQNTAKPDYSDLQLAGQFGGPLKIPGLLRTGPNLFVGYQRTSDHSAITQPTVVPTALERGGDFSQSRDAGGAPVQIVDPATGQPFFGNRIPASRVSPQAASLLGYYPLPNLENSGRFNFQTPLVTITRQDTLQTRVTQAPFGRNQTFGNATYQRTSTVSTNVFGFTDTTTVSGLDAAVNWSRRFSQFFSLRLRYQYTGLSTEVAPYFANRLNVSGAAGITGNDQDPQNWGPPTLAFASGIEGLSSAAYTSNHTQTHVWAAESLVSRGRHNLTVGGGVHRQLVDVMSQQNARGSFAFTGAATGNDLADFLLGAADTSAIAFGNADKYLRAPSYEAYFTDDWRVSPALTINAGVRWEYDAPFSERDGRLVNLDIARGFTSVAPVIASNPLGTLTGERYPQSLIRSDWSGLQPRLGVAWRPLPASSLVIRGGYGVYRNTNVYQSVALLLAQQPPLSKTFSVQSSASRPLTLSDGFDVSPGFAANTFAVDPDFRVGRAENWQLSVQKDLPASLTVLMSYLGTRGTRLLQEVLPNTYPIGAINPCPTCPSGFVYLTSNGRSARQAGQFQLRRRLRNGFTATAQYTLSKADDDAGAFNAAGLNGSAIAQDWQHPDADYGPSNFDQRHLVTAQLQYSSGVGVTGGALIDGLKGSLLKGWTVTTQFTTGSGLPFTPVYLAAVPGTGVTGTIRPDLTSAVIDSTAAGYYLNPAAFAAPATGRWGTAGRNSLTGPAQFSLNAGITRSFPWRDRLNLDWRLDATNVLNRVTYTGVNALFGSPQFGLPSRANTMRRVQTTLRVRF